VADIVPRRQIRSERRPSERRLADLSEINEIAAALDIEPPSGGFDVGLTSDDLVV
jgi:hypothetical protein